MGVTSTTFTDAAGVLWGIDVDSDTSVEIRRFRLPLDRQPAKVRLETLLDESADDLMRLQWRIDHIDDYGFGPAVKTAVLNALNNRKTAALARDVALLTAWRQL